MNGLDAYTILESDCFRLFHNPETFHYGPRCRNRDVVGCGVRFTPKQGSDNHVAVFFTHNGVEFGENLTFIRY